MQERFERVGWDVTESDCWEWRGGRSERGYGQFRAPGRSWVAPRASHYIYIGPIPEGLVVLHECDNPPCVNPAHLRAGTTADNSDDKVSKGRQAKGEDVNTNKLAAEHVFEIRRQIAEGRRTSTLAKSFGVSPSAISDIKAGRTWAWLHQNHQDSVAA
ncbi:HNH endonuclease [Arthrobacter sp. ISL-95]|nr:HNH endonuclease [Arthrobacter sp. ISL-95]